MMPVRPTACTYRFVGLLARRNWHVRHKAIVLPIPEVVANNCLDQPLAADIVRGHRRIKGLLASFRDTCLRDPLNTVKALLKHLFGIWNEITLVPQPESVPIHSTRIPIIATNRSDIDPGALGIHRMHQPTAAHG